MTGLVDLSPAHLAIVEHILAEHVPECEVRAFGSRATWNARDTSDLDLAVVGDGPLPSRTLTMLKEAFEESRLPMRVDVIDWNVITDGFRASINPNTVVVQNAALPCGWRQVVFGECAVLVRDTVSPTDMGDVPYVGLEHIGEGTLSLVGSGVATDVTSAKSRFKNNDVLFGKLRPYFRKVVRARFDGICSTDIWVIRPAKGVDAGYLFYVMASQEFVDAATRGSEGTRMPRAKWDFVSRIRLRLPPLEEQRAIARVLGALDDKIELNQRMSVTLEEMARALFKSWFMDFDPVYAKAKGQPSGLPSDLDALFPAAFEMSELGEIPVGWEVKKLGELCHKPQYGYTQSAQDQPVGPKFLRITDINKGAWVVWDSVPYCQITPEDNEKYRLREGDVLIARMADPGHGCVVEGERNAVFASYLIRFRPLHGYFGRFLQYWMRSDKYWQLVRERGAGTTRLSLNAKVLSRFPIAVPSHGLLDVFGYSVDKLRSRIVTNVLESSMLAAQRDALLPRLVSGEVRSREMLRTGNTYAVTRL